MELNYLYEFIVLAKHKNYHTASELLGISQPTLTNHIKRLETELEVTLFDRTTRNVELNDYGRIFYPYAESFTELYSNSIKAINARRHADKVVLTVAIEPQYMVGNLLRVFNSFKREHPNVVIKITNVPSSSVYSYLRTGRCDLVITPQYTRQDSEFNTLLIREEHAVAFVREDHPIALKKAVEISDLRDTNLFIPPTRLVLYKLLSSACRTAGFELNADCLGISELMGVMLAKQGLGIAIMPDYAAARLADDSLRVINIEPELKWYINLLYANISLLPEGKEFLDYVRESLIGDSEEPA